MTILPQEQGKVHQQDTNTAQNSTKNTPTAYEWAQKCHEWGINVIPLIPGTKQPAGFHSGEVLPHYKQRQSDQFIQNAADRFTRSLSLVNGVNGIVSLDIDDVNDASIIDTILDLLSLDRSYPWLVKTGGNGYNMPFLFLDTEEDLLELGFPPRLGTDNAKAFYKQDALDQNQFSHLEFRLKECQTVMPPSSHKSGNNYCYMNGFPAQRPELVCAQSIKSVFNTLCVPFKEPTIYSAQPGDKEAIHITRDMETHYGKVALQRIVSGYRKLKKNRYLQFWACMCQLYTLANGGELNHSHVEEEMMSAARDNGGWIKHGKAAFEIQMSNAYLQATARKQVSKEAKLNEAKMKNINYMRQYIQTNRVESENVDDGR